MAYLIDIDGTVADLTHRLHFIEKKPADWDGFFAACPDDEPIEDVIETVLCLATSGHKLFMVSGRSDAVREPTLRWLKRHGIRCDELYMRKAGDHRQDDIVKGELLDRIRQDYPSERIFGVFEDRQQVVDMYRKRGLRVFQVAKGDF